MGKSSIGKPTSKRFNKTIEFFLPNLVLSLTHNLPMRMQRVMIIGKDIFVVLLIENFLTKRLSLKKKIWYIVWYHRQIDKEISQIML
jgi:hypothetical protein